MGLRVEPHLCVQQGAIRRPMLAVVRRVPLRFVEPADEVDTHGRLQPHHVGAVELGFERRKKLLVPAALGFNHRRHNVKRRAIFASPQCIDPDVSALADRAPGTRLISTSRLAMIAVK